MPNENSLDQAPNQNEHLDPYVDALTGLHNRLALVEELDRQVQVNSGKFALIFVDLDDFKQTNDTLGHKAGDEKLIKSANILKESARTQPSDTPRGLDILGRAVFRLSGDEFVVILSDIKDQDSVDKTIERFQANLQEKGHIKASMGGQIHTEGQSSGELLDAVDKLMYQQKHGRKSEQALAERQKYRKQLESMPHNKFWVHMLGRLFINKSGIDKKF